MLKSKRFLSFVIEVIIYLTGVFFFNVEPLSFAEGLALIFSPYQIAQSIRKSDLETNNFKKDE